MGVMDYVALGAEAVFFGPAAFEFLGLSVSQTVLMVVAGFLLGIAVGATPGLAGPMAMAISLPILISIFGFSEQALLPVFAFLIGIMKGATVGGAVPAILFNTPGTPDAYVTTLDGHPMARRGRAPLALRVAHFSSASGDTFSDIVLIICAPFLAVVVERYLGLSEKAALLLLSMSFIVAVVGKSAAKGLISMGLGLLAATVGTGQDFTPRMTAGADALASGLPVAGVILGVLILGEIFKALEDWWRESRAAGGGERQAANAVTTQHEKLTPQVLKRIAPYIGQSAIIGTVVGALPGIGSTLAATLGYAAGRGRHNRTAGAPEGERFGDGIPEGVAATEAANSSVSGANLIPVLSLGIPGNAAAVFLILAADTIGGFNPGPSVFRFPSDEVNAELVIAFGIFVLMLLANLVNWTIGGVFMRSLGFLTKIPKQRMLPVIILLTLTSVYVQEPSLVYVWVTIGFGFLGYVMRRLEVSPLPFVIAFILADNLEETIRQAYSASGADPWFMFSSFTSVGFLALAAFVLVYPALRSRRQRRVAQ